MEQFTFHFKVHHLCVLGGFFAFTANLFSIQGQGVLVFNLFFVQLPTVAFLD